MDNPNQHPSDPGDANTGSGNQVGGNVDSENLLQDIIIHGEEDSGRSFGIFSTFDSIRSRFISTNADNQLEELTARRRMLTYLLIVLMILIIVGLNFLPYVDSATSSNEPVIFSTYYTSKYRICLPQSLSEIYNKHYPVDSKSSSKSNKTNINKSESESYRPEDSEFSEFSQSSVDFNENGERCVDGDVDITLFYKDVNLDGYYRVYAAMSFELDYQGKWYQVWKNRHFFSTKNKYRRLIFALSNLISVDHMRNAELSDKQVMNTESTGTDERGGDTSERTGEENPEDLEESEKIDNENFEKLEKEFQKMVLEGERLEKELENVDSSGHLYMSSFVPNFINTRNLPDEFKKVRELQRKENKENRNKNDRENEGENNEGGEHEIRKDGNRMLNSIRLNKWNEFASQEGIRSYNFDIKLKTDPLLYYTTINSKKRMNSRPRISILPKKKLKSLRELDEFYLLNLRKYVQNEYQHISNFDLSIYNIFNLTNISNLFSNKGSKNKDDSTTIATGIGANTSSDTGTQNTEGMHVIGKEVLEKYFNPVNRFEDDKKRVKELEDKEKESRGVESSNTTGTSTNSNNTSDLDDFSGVLDSNDTGIRLYFKGTEKDMRVLKRMISLFSIIFVLKCLLETVLFYKQFSRVERGGMASSVSLTALCMLSYQEVLEIFLLLYHGGIFFDNLIHFGALVVLKFFLLCIVHQNFIVLVWRATHSQHIRQGWIHTQRAFVLFYRYYFTFVFVLLTIWYYYYNVTPIVICLAYLAWFPQIMLDIWRGQNNSLDFLFIFVSVVLKLSFPFYIFYVKDNVFNYDQFSADSVQLNRNVVYLLSFLSSFQLMLISIQRLYGPRHFAKWSILPKIYSYVRPWSKMMQDDPQECVICMYNIIQSNRDWYLTPCDHLFHANCLREWTSIKLECPNCRRPLPPIT